MKSSEVGDIHIEHYNHLFSGGIVANAVANTPSLEYRGFRLIFERIEVHKPYVTADSKNTQMDRRLLPRDCRERELTYGGSCFLKMKLFYKNTMLFDDFKVAGLFPVMVRSELCHSACSRDDMLQMGEDPDEAGGYFIVSGYDRVVRFHIAMKRNHLFVFKNKQKDTSYSEYSCVIRSVGADELGQKNEIKLCNDGNILVKMYLRKRMYYIPVILILRSLVDTTDEEIFKSLGSNRRVLNFLYRMDEERVYSQREALSFLGKRFRSLLRVEDPVECGRELLNQLFFVHLSRMDDKYNLLLEAIRRIFLVSSGAIVPDDIDLPSNQEVYSEVQLFSLCIREKLEEIKKLLQLRILNVTRTRVPSRDSTTSLSASEAQDLSAELSSTQVSDILKGFNSIDFSIGAKITRFLSTGNITVNSISDILQTVGFTFLAERINYWRFASHFQSISRGASFSAMKITKIRKLRPEGWGFICPIHTPDGSPCGILLHLARGCAVLSSPGIFNPTLLYEYGVVPNTRNSPALYFLTPCFFNGKLMGWASNPTKLTLSLRHYRSLTGIQVEISHEFGIGIREAVYIHNSTGTMMRRVFNIDTNNTDWIGTKEQVFLDIKLSDYETEDNYNEKCDVNFKKKEEWKMRYRELNNTLMFSTVAATIPFANHNPSPRNIYQCQMAKQAMGISSHNFKSRTDTKTYTVNYLQLPMVQAVGYSTLSPFPIGFNCIVAVLSYTAYDMEDAVVINKSACERGLFSAFVYKCEKFEAERNSRIEYTPEIGETVQPGDVLLECSSEEAGKSVHRYNGTEQGIIDRVAIYENSKLGVAITIRINRNPTIGDKFCSRHGQKGVVSSFWNEVDMPFTEQGLRPDIIINPHAFPSRMTIAMMLESMCGKSALVNGEIVDATPFENQVVFREDAGGIVNIGEELRKCGFNFYGNEPMYSGVAGTEFRTDIFIGSVFYQRLRHMVKDKFQVRTSGTVVSTTRQPVGGRKNKGGVRFGEMERDALIAHGASFLLQDRLLDCSDRTVFQWCQSCKSILFISENGCVCSNSQLRRIELPYVFKYLCCELLSMNIRVKLDVDSASS